MRVARFGGINVQTLLVLLAGAVFCYSAWLTSIVFCAASGRGPLLVASAMFPPVGVVHGVGVWFGGW